MSTNRPSFQWFAGSFKAGLPSLVVGVVRAAGEEVSYARVAALAQVVRVAAGDDTRALAVQHDAVLGDLENTVEVVGDHDQGQAEFSIQGQEQVVELGGSDRVEAG